MHFRLIKTPIPLIPSLQLGDWVGCDCNALNRTLVTPPADSKVTFLTPTSAPAVLDNPVLLPSLLAAAIPHQQHSVVGQLEGIERVCEACVVVDAPPIAHEVRVDLCKDRDNLILHFCGQV